MSFNYSPNVEFKCAHNIQDLFYGFMAYKSMNKMAIGGIRDEDSVCIALPGRAIRLRSGRARCSSM